MSAYKRCKIFFRNTLVAHKQTEKPYFMGVEVLQEIRNCICAVYGNPTNVMFVVFFEVMIVVYLYCRIYSQQYIFNYYVNKRNESVIYNARDIVVLQNQSYNVL